MDQEEAAQRAPTPSSRRPYKSTRQRLLERCARNNAISWVNSPTIQLKAADPEEDKMDVEVSHPAKSSLSPVVPSSALPDAAVADASKAEGDQDADMQDAPSEDVAGPEVKVDTQESPEQTQSDVALSASQDASSADAHVPPLAPVLDSTESEAGEESSKPPDMKIEMPPPPANPFAQPVLPGGPSAQSPGSLTTAPVFSPAVTAAVSPSPARKKLSLSDYTRRSKAKDKDPDSKADRESSPASTASGPAAAVPVIQPSSSGEAAAAEGGSAIDDDVKMEDADATQAVVPPSAE
jgi:hypothetical protein